MVTRQWVSVALQRENARVLIHAAERRRQPVIAARIRDAAMRGDGIEDDSDVAASGFDPVVARAPLPAGPRFSDAQAEAHMANRDAALALEHSFQERYAAGVARAEAAAAAARASADGSDAVDDSVTPAVVVDADGGAGDGAGGADVADAAPDPPEDYTMGTRTYAATDEASRAILDADVSPADVPADSTCVICIESLCDERAETEGGGVVRWPSCGHLFHRICTRNFLRTDHRCPSCRSAVPHVSHGTSTAGVIRQANGDGVASSSQDDRPYQLAEFDMDDYAGHSAYDSSITHWQIVVDLFGQGLPVTYDMLRNEDVPCPRQLARNRAAQRARRAAVDDDGGSIDSRPTLPPPSYDGDSQLTRTISPRSEPGSPASPASPVQPNAQWPDLEAEDEPHVERHAATLRNYIAGDGPHSFAGSGGALSPLFMVLVHHGLRRNGIALPAGVRLDGATAGPLWGGHVAEAAWQSVFASARNLDGWANCLTMAVESVGAVAPARVDEILLTMAAGGYIHRREQEELLRGAAAAGLSAEDQANLAAGSDSLAVQQQAQDSSADAVVAGAAGAAAFLAHSTRAVLRDAARRDGAS